MRLSIPFVAASLLAVSGLTQAATVSYTSNVVTLTTTNWSNNLGLQQFDPSLGTLESVTIDLFGEVRGNARAESLDAKPATLTLQLGAQLTLARPDLSTLVVSLPVVNHTFNAAAFDGSLDWGGASGVALLGIGATQTGSFSTTAAGDLSLFTGTGSVMAPLKAAGQSSASGAANLASWFETQAGAQAQVTYSYAAAVPEPGTWALMLAGLGAVGVLSARRRA